uniref:Uncharacterized protein n=1 Tax=Rhizophora mucronata TaxID=61149 RepID=A0A2P2LQG1_RHIMU
MEISENYILSCQMNRKFTRSNAHFTIEKGFLFIIFNFLNDLIVEFFLLKGTFP